MTFSEWAPRRTDRILLTLCALCKEKGGEPRRLSEIAGSNGKKCHLVFGPSR